MKLFLMAATVLTVFSGCRSASDKEGKTDHENNAGMSSAIMTDPEKIPASAVPDNISVKGMIQEAWKWTDKLGENILVTSVAGPYDDTEKNEYDEEGQTTELHAALFVKKENGYQATWVMNDKEKACPFDITCAFIPNSTTITDLDRNGFAEIKVQYLLACRSDVSPAVMKLVMRENENTYSLEGWTWLPVEEGARFDITADNVNLENLPAIKNEMNEWLRTFGRYKTEKSFASAAPEFLNYARSEWLKHVKENIGE